MNGNGSSNASGSTSAQVVLGSMERAEEYGTILTTLKANGGDVQGEMVDRILGGGKYLISNPRTAQIPSSFLPSVKPLGYVVGIRKDEEAEWCIRILGYHAKVKLLTRTFSNFVTFPAGHYSPRSPTSITPNSALRDPTIDPTIHPSPIFSSRIGLGDYESTPTTLSGELRAPPPYPFCQCDRLHFPFYFYRLRPCSRFYPSFRIRIRFDNYNSWWYYK